MTEATGTLGSLYTVGDIMSSFKPPMGEGNTGSFDTPFGGKGGPSGEFTPPIPPAPKAEGASSGGFTPPVPKIEGAKFTPPVPPAPKTPQEGFEGDSSETEKGGRGNPSAKSRGDSGRPKSTRRMWPWVAAVAVVAIVSGVLGYGYFANAGNNPVGEKLGFSHAKVTDQSTSDPNNGEYGTPTDGSSEAQQGKESPSNGQGNNVPNPSATTRAESGTDTLTDADYGKEAVDKRREGVPTYKYITNMFQDYKAQYVPNNTAESFVRSAGKMAGDKSNSLSALGDTMRVELRRNVPTSDFDKYDKMGEFVSNYGVGILTLAYEAGVPDPKIDIAWYDKETNNLVCELKGLTLKGKWSDYPFSIPGTDPNLWRRAMLIDELGE